MVASDSLIVKKEALSLRLFRPRPIPEPGIALVLFREGQPLVTLWPGNRLTSGEVKWGNYRTAYHVDITEHSFTLACLLPCRGEAFDFQTQINVAYCVGDPGRIVERNVTDAREVLEPLILSTMRDISRNYEVEESAEAEKEIMERVWVVSQRYDTGLKLNRFVVKLSLEDEARNHLRQLKQIERSKAYELQQAVLDKQRISQEMDRTQMRMNFYSPMIKEGQWQLLALQLANHPDDVTSVAQMIHQQRQVELENRLKALKIMLEEDALEGFQMEAASRHILERFVESFGPELDAKALGAPERQKAIEAKQTSKPTKDE